MVHAAPGMSKVVVTVRLSLPLLVLALGCTQPAPPARIDSIEVGEGPHRLALPVAASADEAQILLARRPDLQQFLATEGHGWTVSFDRRSGEPMLLAGPGISWTTLDPRFDALPKAAHLAATSIAVSEQAATFAAQRPSVFGSGLELDARASGTADQDGTLVFAKFRYAPHGVRHRDANLTFVVEGGKLVQIHADRMFTAYADTVPSLSSDEAVARLVRDAGVTQAPTSLSSTLEVALLGASGEAPGVYTGPIGAGYEPHLAYAIRFTLPDDIKTYAALVDAHTGDTLDLWDDNHYGSVTGGVVLRNATTETVLPFGGTLVTNGTSKVTDLGGNYTYESGTATTTLAGSWFRLLDFCGNPNASTILAPGDLSLGTSTATDCSFSSTGHSTRAARTSIYSLDNARRMGAKWLSGANATASAWFDTNVGVNVNISQTCNAFWDGSTLNFFKSGGGCTNTGELVDVATHEWAHGLDQNTKTGSVGDAAKGEAIADTFAFLMSHETCIAPGFFQTSGSSETTQCDTSVRDMSLVITTANISSTCARSTSCAGALGFECHCESHLLSGAHWVLAQLFVARYGTDEGWNQFEKDFLRALPLMTSYQPNTAGNAYDAWLAADDDNGNIADGTPNADLIFQAFSARGIAGAELPRNDAACPTRPAGPVVTATPGVGGVALSWTTVDNATSYAIYRSQAHNDSQGFLPLANVTGTSYTDTEVRTGLPYSYQVVATVGACTSPFGGGTSATPTAGDDFSLSITPASATVVAGASISVEVRTLVTSGVEQPVALAVAGLPAGVTATFSPPIVTSGQIASLTFTAATTTAIGTTSYTVTGTGTTSHAATASLTVTAPPPDDFSLSLSPPTVAVAAGSSVNVAVTSTVTSGNPQPITLSIPTLPVGVTATFTPATIIAGGTATLTFTAASTASATAAGYQVKGTAASGVHFAEGTVSVTANPLTVLANGVPLTNRAGAAGSETRYVLRVPANQLVLAFTTFGGTGDIDLYVKYGSPPTTTSYDCRSHLRGNNEACAVRPTAGNWYVMLRGNTPYAGVSLLGVYGGLLH